MIGLYDNVSVIPKVGPKYKAELKKLGLETVEDLVYYFPFRYTDYSHLKKVNDLRVGDVATAITTLEKINTVYTKSRKVLTKATFSDETGKINAVWFNQRYLQKMLQTGGNYSISGKIDLFSNKPVFVSPDTELADGNRLNTGRFVPVYSETAGVSSKWLRAKIFFALSHMPTIDEYMPTWLLKKHAFPGVAEALANIHFPTTAEAAQGARTRFAYEEVFFEMLKVQKRKHEWDDALQSAVLQVTAGTLKAFIKKLPFELTNDQKSAVTNIVADLTSTRPMNRLLEGDVGTGKTIVAVIAAYIANQSGFKTLCMAPTEILAKQHWDTFCEFLPNTALLTGATPKSDLSGYDNIIGTHALLFSKAFPQKVGLVVVDEQHRFGVAQRALLAKPDKTKHAPHLLTLTATPIPRTLALTLFGDLSVSTLITPPNKEKQVTTWVVDETKRAAAFDWIKNRNEQVFVVCPLIEASEHESLANVKSAQTEYKRLKEGVFKDVAVGLLHGRMKSDEKQSVLNDFKIKRLKILVSTPVIEVGVDIPEATIMVIESAERYGLASLHQLRGRVGRGEKQAYCLLFTSVQSRNSVSRLRHLEQEKSGLKLAEIDLKLRGKGDLYGIKQHGFERFKLADLEDLKLLEDANSDAQATFAKLADFPQLAQKVHKMYNGPVAEN